jgi:hypothetical protein
MNTAYRFTIIPLGEFRMGTEGFGVQIQTPDGRIESLANEIVFHRPGHADEESGWHEHFLDSSADGRFLIIEGAFSTFVVDLEELTLSLYKDTIRSIDKIWSEETPIYGEDTFHINGKRRHYYLQFPFIEDPDFPRHRSAYHALRLRQISEAKMTGKFRRAR